MSSEPNNPTGVESAPLLERIAELEAAWVLPSGPWRNWWHGSGPERGDYIMSTDGQIAYLPAPDGTTWSHDQAGAIVYAHNIALSAMTVERDRLRAEVDALRGFAQRVMQSWPHGDVDGGNLQDYAHAAGLLERVTASEPCGETCSCAEWGEWPIDCFRPTGLLRGSGEWINPLAAEVEALRADADRYREVRRGQTFSVVDWVGAHYRAESADAAVDAAIAARAAKGEGSEG